MCHSHSWSKQTSPPSFCMTGIGAVQPGALLAFPGHLCTPNLALGQALGLAVKVLYGTRHRQWNVWVPASCAWPGAELQALGLSASSWLTLDPALDTVAMETRRYKRSLSSSLFFK